MIDVRRRQVPENRPNDDQTHYRIEQGDQEWSDPLTFGKRDVARVHAASSNQHHDHDEDAEDDNRSSATVIGRRIHSTTLTAEPNGEMRSRVPARKEEPCR